MRLSDPVTQSLRKGTIVILDRLHVPANAGVAARATYNADSRGALIEFAPGDLNTAVVKGQCPLALEAVSNTGPQASTTVVADVFMLFIQQRLIENQYVAH